jgi:hypothetical protein
MKRRYARNQSLPSHIVHHLQILEFQEKDSIRVKSAMKSLFEEGWTLRAIGAAFLPKYTASKVYRLIQSIEPIDEALLKDSNLRPTPKYKTLADGKYPSSTPKSPGIDVPTQNQLRQLASLAKEYRSGMASTSPQSIANSQLDQLVMKLYKNHVKIAEIAKACEVTHRAVSKRIAKNAHNS